VSKKDEGLARSLAMSSKTDPWLRVSVITASNFRNLLHCGVDLPENLTSVRTMSLRSTALHLAGGIVIRHERIACSIRCVKISGNAKRQLIHARKFEKAAHLSLHLLDLQGENRSLSPTVRQVSATCNRVFLKSKITSVSGLLGASGGGRVPSLLR
jgi:hypothetical protein